MILCRTFEQLKDIRGVYSRDALDTYKIKARLPILSSVLQVFQDTNFDPHKGVWEFASLKLLLTNNRIAIFSCDIMFAEIKNGYIYYYFCDSNVHTEKIDEHDMVSEMGYLYLKVFSTAEQLKKYEISIEYKRE